MGSYSSQGNTDTQSAINSAHTPLVSNSEWPIQLLCLVLDGGRNWTKAYTIRTVESSFIRSLLCQGCVEHTNFTHIEGPELRSKPRTFLSFYNEAAVLKLALVCSKMQLIKMFYNRNTLISASPFVMSHKFIALVRFTHLLVWWSAIQPSHPSIHCLHPSGKARHSSPSLSQ